MASFFWRIPPIVVEAIAIGDRLADQLGDGKIVERCQAHPGIGPAQRVDRAMAVRRRPAFAAETVMGFKAFAAAPIVAQVFLAAQQGKVFGFNLRVPVALFPAIGAVALAAAFKIHLYFKRHAPAVAAAMICFQQDGFLSLYGSSLQSKLTTTFGAGKAAFDEGAAALCHGPPTSNAAIDGYAPSICAPSSK